MNPSPSDFPNSIFQFIFSSTRQGSYLDRKILIMLLDGRILIGTIRSFVQGAIVVSDAFERIIVGHQYCDKPIGLLVLKVENVVLLGESDSSSPGLPPHMTNVSLPEILTAKKEEEGSSLFQRNLKKWREDFLD